MAHVLKGSHSFTCTPHIHPLTEWTIPAFAFSAEAGTHLPLPPEGWKAELALWTYCHHAAAVSFRDAVIRCMQSAGDGCVLCRVVIVWQCYIWCSSVGLMLACVVSFCTVSAPLPWHSTGISTRCQCWQILHNVLCCIVQLTVFSVSMWVVLHVIASPMYLWQPLLITDNSFSQHSDAHTDSLTHYSWLLRL